MTSEKKHLIFLSCSHTNIPLSLKNKYTIFISVSLHQSGGGGGGPRVAVNASSGVSEAPRPELIEQDSKDSAQSISTSSSSEIQPEYNVRCMFGGGRMEGHESDIRTRV